MFWVTKKNFTKNFHTNFHINGSFWGGMVTLRELGLQNSTLRKLGLYQGISKLTDHLCWLWSRLSIYNAPVKALRELGFHAEIGVVPRNEQINRGVGKFYNETPLIDDQRLIIYIAAVCIVTSHRYCSPPRLKCWVGRLRHKIWVAVFSSNTVNSVSSISVLMLKHHVSS